jgi:hypothetical protein
MFKLRTKPTQFTKGKTEDTLCDLTQRYLLNVNENEHMTHMKIIKMYLKLGMKPNTQYNIDLAKDEYIHDGFINSINTLWITYKY